MIWPATPDALSLLLRAGSYLAVLQAAGISVFLLLFAGHLSRSEPDIRRLGCRTAQLGMALLVLRQLLEGGRMAGEMRGVLDPALQTLALRATGAALLAQFTGLALMAWGLRGRSPRESHPACALRLGGALLALLGFALTGHTSIDPHRGRAAALLILHLSILAFWIGALWPLAAVSRRAPAGATAVLVERFSAMAVWLVPCIAVFGAALTAVLVPGWSTFSHPYGRLILAKLTLFALLMMLAALNRWRFGPRLGRGESALAARNFRRAVVAEFALVCIVLAITALMTMLYSPEPA